MVLRIGTVMRRRSLPQVVIPAPCHVDWNTMTRVDSRGRARFCGSCERPAYETRQVKGQLTVVDPDRLSWERSLSGRHSCVSGRAPEKIASLAASSGRRRL